jgi:hypothetical protein
LPNSIISGNCRFYGFSLRVFTVKKRPTPLYPPRPFGFKRNINAAKARQMMLKSESFHDESFKRSSRFRTTAYALDQWTFMYLGHALSVLYFIILYSQHLCYGNFSLRAEGMGRGGSEAAWVSFTVNTLMFCCSANLGSS